MLSLVGSPPSSGSTLLADLLDSTAYSACGPELEFFSNKNLYDFHQFKKNIKETSHVVQLRSTGIFPKYNRLDAFGLDEKNLHRKVHKASNLTEFFDDFAAYFLAFRNKDTKGIMFEKTPQNLNCVKEYLQHYPKGFFIIIVRNPLYVYNSLLNRKWGSYTALCTWLISTATFINLLDHKKVILIKYENLVNSPFEITSAILKSIKNLNVPPSIIESGYKGNDYRAKFSPALKSWEFKSRNMIRNANKKIIQPKIKEEFSKLLNVKISKLYADHYGIPDMSFQTILKQLGYEDDVMELLSDVRPKYGMPQYTWQDFRKLTAKWIREIKGGHSNLGDLWKLYHAVEPA